MGRECLYIMGTYYGREIESVHITSRDKSKNKWKEHSGKPVRVVGTPE